MTLAVDGGNSKTDLALVRGDGALLAFARGPLGSPHHIGLQGIRGLLEGPARRGRRVPRLARIADRSPPARHLMLAGLDFPAEERRVPAAVDGLRLGRPDHRGQRHLRGPARRHRTWLGRGGDVRRRHQLRGRGTGWPPRPLPVPRLRSPATGAAARTSGSRPSVRRRGARTGADRRRGSSQSVPAHFGLPRHSRSPRPSTPERTRAPAGRARRRWCSRRRTATRSRRMLAPARRRDRGFVRAAIERLDWRAGPRGAARRWADPGGERPLVRTQADHLAGLGLAAEVRAVSSPPIVGAALLAPRRHRRRPGPRTAARRELDEAAAQHGWVAGDPDDKRRRRRRPSSRDRPRRWLTSASSGDPDYPGSTCRPRWTSTSTSRMASSWSWSARPGSGKTTALRMLAGLEEVDAGAIWIGDAGCDRPRPEGSRRRDGLPELRAVPIPHGRGQHRLPADDGEGPQGGTRAAGRDDRRDARPDATTSRASRVSCPAASASASRWAGAIVRSPACS